MKILKFQASWCQPCKMLSKVVDGVRDQVKLPVEEVDIDQNMDMAKAFNVRGVPMLVVVDDKGSVVRSKSGYMSEKDFLEFANQ